ncbi:MAG: ABC-2 family transporter protein [Candidatus Eremiobacteraeota bacterium]|nr:ABC-2 family transporter protein [Candidatus Eremiobacteraeota bacterium]MBC5828307.1 ABC-2 family transporter protein [Candidatus Eremiobacteraeota bacterium]
MADAGARHWSAYREFWRLNFLTLMEYKVNFFIWLAFTIVYHGVALGAIWIMMSRFPSMNGWHWQQVFFLYALYMLGHTLNNTFFFTIGEVPDLVREGRFDRLLVRPLDPLFQVLSQPGQIWPDELVIALIVFILAQGAVHLQWSSSTVVLLVLATLGGAYIDFAIQLIIATLSFWVVRLDALRWVVMSLENDFTRYPLSIYNRAVRIMLAYVFPFAFMNYFPATVLLHKSAEVGYTFNPQLGWLTPVVGAVWFAAAYSFWRLGLNKYQGTGS